MRMSDIREAIITKVETISGFKQVPFLGEYIGRVQNTLAHKGFNVTLSSSQTMDSRDRRPIYYLDTTVRVRFAYRLRPHDQNTDYNSALESEESIIEAVLGSYASIQAGIQIKYARSTRQPVDSLEYIIIEIEFTTLHHLQTGA